jgi:thiosulfate reductase cytochrome b subunit
MTRRLWIQRFVHGMALAFASNWVIRGYVEIGQGWHSGAGVDFLLAAGWVVYVLFDVLITATPSGKEPPR